jgi:hypothetical protein
MPLARCSELVVHSTILDGREDTSVDELERVPFSRTLRLEVPPEPALCLGLERSDLGLDVTSGLVLVGGGPFREITLPTAVADEGAAGIGAVVARADVKAIKVLRAVTGGMSVRVLYAVCGRYTHVIAEVHSPTKVHLSAPLYFSELAQANSACWAGDL